MKKLIITIVLFHSLSLIAQNEPATLFKSANINSWGFFVGAELQNTNLYNEYVGIAALKAGIIINNTWTFGGFIGESINSVTPIPSHGALSQYEEFDFSLYGGFVEYRLKPSSLLHLAFPLSLGIFDADYDYFDNVLGFSDDYDERYNFFVEPGINLELNLAKHLKVYSGLSYRLNVVDIYRYGANLPNAQNHVLFNIGLKLGLFSIIPKEKKAANL